jgi:hypothetical protein
VLVRLWCILAWVSCHVEYVKSVIVFFQVQLVRAGSGVLVPMNAAPVSRPLIIAISKHFRAQQDLCKNNEKCMH